MYKVVTTSLISRNISSDQIPDGTILDSDISGPISWVKISKSNAVVSDLGGNKEDYNFFIYKNGSTNFQVKRGTDNSIVYSTADTTDALGTFQYCRDNGGGVIKVDGNTLYPISATLSIIGGTHSNLLFKANGSNSPLGANADIRVTGDFPAVTLDGQTASINGIYFEGLQFSHNVIGYTNGLIRVIDSAVENTFRNCSFYDNGKFVGYAFKFEILNTSVLKAQYEIRVTDFTSRGFDSFIAINNQASASVLGSFISSFKFTHGFIWLSKRILTVTGVSGAQVLDWEFEDITWQYTASNSVGAGNGVFGMDSVVSCWGHKHTDCQLWDISTPGINYANVGSSVELYLKGCSPAQRIGGSGASLGKVKIDDYYVSQINAQAMGIIAPSYIGDGTRIGEGTLAGCSVLQAPSQRTDSTSPYLEFNSGATANTNTGTRKGGNPFRMDSRFYLEAICGVNDNTTNSRLYVGFNSTGAMAGTDTPLGTTETGILIGYRSTDTNYQIFYNNGAGSPMVVIDTGIPRNVTFNKFVLWSDGSSFTWIVNGTVSAPISGGQVPGATTTMSFIYHAQNTTVAPILFNSRYAKLILRNL